MTESRVSRVLNWLRAGYPQGIPANDFPSVLLVLHHNLTDEEIESVADDLAFNSASNGAAPVTADDIRMMTRTHAFQNATDDDIRRVSSVLASGGWPLSTELR